MTRPVVQATESKFVINLKTAQDARNRNSQALPALLADEVIE